MLNLTQTQATDVQQNRFIVQKQISYSLRRPDHSQVARWGLGLGLGGKVSGCLGFCCPPWCCITISTQWLVHGDACISLVLL